MIIAITSDRRQQSPPSNSHNIRPSRPEIFLSEHLVEKVRECGAQVIVLPVGGGEKLAEWVIEHCDGLIISGGAFDIDPSWYGEIANARIDRVDWKRTEMELMLAKKAMESNFPVLGICGGLQVLAVAGGGTLVQDIKTQSPNALEHEQPSDPKETWHSVELSSSRWQRWFGSDKIMVNSTHHQAVDQLGKFCVTGCSSDGIIEAIEQPNLDFCVGVQWHPELLGTEIFWAMIQAIKEK